MTTPNMTLVLPDVSVTPGPLWASELNDALELVEAHDHTDGKGVTIPTAGITINADFPFNSYNATGLRTVRLETQSAPSEINDRQIIYSQGGELYYKDSAGNAVQITTAGSVAGASGTITGMGSPAAATASFADVTDRFTFTHDGTYAGKFSHSDLDLRPYQTSGAVQNYITLKTPNSIASTYTITLPTAVPAQDGVLQMSAGGVLSGGLGAGSAASPTLYFAGDTNTGVYAIGADQIGFSAGGVLQARVRTGGLEVIAGSVSLPSVSFGTNTTGIYGSSTAVAFTSGGVASGHIDNNAWQPAIPIRLSTDGSAAAPMLSTVGDSDTGFYKDLANEWAFASGGALAMRFRSTGIRGPDGSSSAPVYAFTGATTTGMYRTAGGGIGFTTGAGLRATIGATGIDATVGIATDSNGDFLKWKVFTGTLGTATESTLSVSGSIVGAVGYSTTSLGGGGWAPFESDPSSNTAYFENNDASSASGSVSVRNDTGDSQSYRVTLFYT